MIAELSKGARDLLHEIDRCDGIEWHDEWDDADLRELDAAGMVSFSGRRGPGAAWRRVTLNQTKSPKDNRPCNSDMAEAQMVLALSEAGFTDEQIAWLRRHWSSTHLKESK